MQKIFIIIVFSFYVVSLNAQPELIWQFLADGKIDRWAYAGGDEFEGEQLDTAKWSDNIQGRRDGGSDYFMPGNNNLAVRDGKLELTSRNESGQYEGKHYNYTSGAITSKQAYVFGLFEISFKTPAEKGFWPAFWLQCCFPNEEIDVFEFKGEKPDQVHVDVHCAEGCKNKFGAWLKASGSFSEGFNNMMLEWRPGVLLWYLNGNEIAFTRADFNKKLNLILNSGIAEDCPSAFCPGPDETTRFPAVLEAEFVRIWKRMDPEQAAEIVMPQQAGNTEYTRDTSSSGKIKIARKGIRSRIASIIRKQSGKSETILFAKIFPDATNKTIKIGFSGKYDGEIRLEIINAAGRVVYSESKPAKNMMSLDVSQLEKGIYSLRAMLGLSSVSERLVIE